MLENFRAHAEYGTFYVYKSYRVTPDVSTKWGNTFLNKTTKSVV